LGVWLHRRNDFLFFGALGRFGFTVCAPWLKFALFLCDTFRRFPVFSLSRKDKKMKFKNLLAVVLAASSAVVVTTASAAPVVLTTLTDAVDFSTSSSAILVVGAALIGVYITIRAASFVIGMVKR
jgi:ABC-type bacteriocin/lantibiotic exporter with double-glycine peptidase domain